MNRKKQLLIHGVRPTSDTDASVVKFLKNILKEKNFQPENVVLILVESRKGMYSIAKKAAKELGFEVDTVKADWDGLGRNAVRDRDLKAVQSCDEAMVFYDGSHKGTEAVLEELQQIGTRVIKIISDTIKIERKWSFND